MTPPDHHAPVVVLWERTTGQLLDHTMRFPRAVRFTFARRIDDLALDILERLVEARYAERGRKLALLAEADGRLARLRALLRLATDRGYLSQGALLAVMKPVDETGRMLGGWRRSLARPASTAPQTDAR